MKATVEASPIYLANRLEEKIEVNQLRRTILESCQKVLFIFCDGGLSNRINSLINGLVLSELVKFRPVVVWPSNNRCGANYDEIFESNVLSVNLPLQSFTPIVSELSLWIHENDLKFPGDAYALRDLTLIQAQLLVSSTEDRSVLFSENSLLPWLPSESVATVARALYFKSPLVVRAREIINASVGGMSMQYFGVHLRGTDFPSQPPIEKMLELVRANRERRFFVCSDDRSIEETFKRECNVFIHEKSEYVAKMQEGPWRSMVSDSDGLPYSSNISRSGRSVEEAVVDLLLLANSALVSTSSSTFWGLAHLLRSSGWVSSHLQQLP